MQPSQESPRTLLTALEVQRLLHVDRSTVYRMAEDGRLPALRVGRSWRFPADRIAAVLDGSEPGEGAGAPAPAVPSDPPTPLHSARAPGGATLVTVTDPTASASRAHPTAPRLNTPAADAVVQVAAELLGVMMVVTDMAGHPVTDVVNPCTWFAEHSSDPKVLERCVAEWRELADLPDLTPRFAEGSNGFECARAFVRSGTTLVGMVLAGGISPSPDAAVDPDLYHLDPAQRDHVLTALPRIAAAISSASATSPATGPATVPRRPAEAGPGTNIPWRPTADAPTKENR